MTALTRQVRDLSWEAEHSRDKHLRATAWVQHLEQEVAGLEVVVAQQEEEIARLGAQIQDLQAAMAEERRVWSELISEMHVEQHVDPEPTVNLPLCGKHVVLIGGDPIAAGAVAIIKALGAAGVECCPGFDEEHRLGQAIVAADLAIAVTAYMSHKHAAILKRAMERMDLHVVWVKRLGVAALRRAVVEAFRAVPVFA